MEPFIANYSDPTYVTRERAENYIIELKRDKYNIILKFVNNVLNKKYNTLRDFKNIDIDYVLKNNKNLINIYLLYQQEFELKFKVNLMEKKDSTNDISKNFIKNLKACLKTIEYKLVNFKCNDKVLYTIKN
jgi:hypothetical protein